MTSTDSIEYWIGWVKSRERNSRSNIRRGLEGQGEVRGSRAGQKVTESIQ